MVKMCVDDLSVFQPILTNFIGCMKIQVWDNLELESDKSSLNKS